MRNFLYDSLNEPGRGQSQQQPRAPAQQQRPPESPRRSVSSPLHLVVLLIGLGVGLIVVGVALLLPGGSKAPSPSPSYPAPTGERCGSQLQPKESRCSGCPPMLNGKLCASTTRYNDMTIGSCGCGEQDPVPPDWWTLTALTAALNCKNLDPGNPMLSWCPSGCGACFELCSTGGTTSGKKGTTKAGVCRVFRVTNRCGDGYKEYPEWCSSELTYSECQADPAHCQQQGSTNKYGYPAHFDLQDYHLQVSTGLSWDNAEVTFESVACSRWAGVAQECSKCAGVKPGAARKLWDTGNVTVA